MRLATSAWLLASHSAARRRTQAGSAPPHAATARATAVSLTWLARHFFVTAADEKISAVIAAPPATRPCRDSGRRRGARRAHAARPPPLCRRWASPADRRRRCRRAWAPRDSRPWRDNGRRAGRRRA